MLTRLIQEPATEGCAEYAADLPQGVTVGAKRNETCVTHEGDRVYHWF